MRVPNIKACSASVSLRTKQKHHHLKNTVNLFFAFLFFPTNPMEIYYRYQTWWGLEIVSPFKHGVILGIYFKFQGGIRILNHYLFGISITIIGDPQIAIISFYRFHRDVPIFWEVKGVVFKTPSSPNIPQSSAGRSRDKCLSRWLHERASRDRAWAPSARRMSQPFVVRIIEPRKKNKKTVEIRVVS